MSYFKDQEAVNFYESLQEKSPEVIFLVESYLEINGMPFYDQNWQKAQLVVSSEALNEAKEFIAQEVL